MLVLKILGLPPPKGSNPKTPKSRILGDPWGTMLRSPIYPGHGNCSPLYHFSGYQKEVPEIKSLAAEAFIAIGGYPSWPKKSRMGRRI